MTFNTIIAALATVCLSACISANDVFDIRSSDRPEYARTISPAELSAFVEQGGLLVDARLSEDFEKDPVLIPGAVRVDPEQMSYWRTANRTTPVAVYCVKGKWVSQKQAAHLSSLGFDAYSVEGGLVAYQAFEKTAD